MGGREKVKVGVAEEGCRGRKEEGREGGKEQRNCKMMKNERLGRGMCWVD